jgi:DNA-binding beta-propeller fold protein YncE
MLENARVRQRKTVRDVNQPRRAAHGCRHPLFSNPILHPPARTIGGKTGRGLGEFGFVTDVAQDSQGNYYVSEYGDFDRIQKFDPQGNVVCQIGTHGQSPGSFLRPQGLFIDKEDQLWVADASNHRVQVFDLKTPCPKLIKTWGTAGSAPGQLRYPYTIEVDQQGFVYVCELGNHRIQKFTSDGAYVAIIGGPGRGPGQFHQPWAFATDSSGIMHVIDSYNHRVQRINRRW